MAKDPNQLTLSEISQSLKDINERDAVNSALEKNEKLIDRALENKRNEYSEETIEQLRKTKELITGDKLQSMEDKREANRQLDEQLRLLGIIAENTLEKDTGIPKLKGFGQIALGFIAALSAALIGLVVGIVQGLGTQLKAIVKFLGKGLRTAFGGFFRSLTAPFKGITKSTRGFLKPVTDFFKNISRAFKAGFGGLKTFRSTTGQFAKLGFFGTIGKTLGNAFRTISGFGKTLVGFGRSISGIARTIAGAKFLNIAAPFKSFLNGIRNIGKALMPVKNVAKGASGIGKFLQPVFKIAKSFFNVFRAFGQVIGKILIPIQVIFSAIDGIRGFIDGFKNQEGGFLNKMVAGLSGAISGILQGLIGIPLDLLKKGVAWILGKMGFENASEFLKSFSIKDLIGKLFDGINKIWQGILNFFGNMFSEEGRAENMKKLQVFGDVMSNFIKKILRIILPDPDADREWYDPRGLVAKAIPSSVYRYAGLDPDTGDVIEKEDITNKLVDDSNMDSSFIGPVPDQDIIKKNDNSQFDNLNKPEVINPATLAQNAQQYNQRVNNNSSNNSYNYYTADPTDILGNALNSPT